MLKAFNIEFEKAVRLLVENTPESDETIRKPLLFHYLRVGVYLYEKGYERDIVLAGVLHDALEFTKLTSKTINDEFGNEVARLVAANTKNDLITDKNEKTTELIQRCAANGAKSLVVKCADIIDSFKFYSQENNIDQLKYCVRNANAIFKFKPTDFKDTILDELHEWQNKYKNLSD